MIALIVPHSELEVTGPPALMLPEADIPTASDSTTEMFQPSAKINGIQCSH